MKCKRCKTNQRANELTAFCLACLNQMRGPETANEKKYREKSMFSFFIDHRNRVWRTCHGNKGMGAGIPRPDAVSTYPKRG